MTFQGLLIPKVQYLSVLCTEKNLKQNKQKNTTKQTDKSGFTQNSGIIFYVLC